MRQGFLHIILLIVLVLPSTVFCYAQDSEDEYVMPQPRLQISVPKKSEVRQEIDAKRSLEDIGGKDALYRGREFIRLDPNYYVGYLFEAMAKYNSAADELGYQMAAQSFATAMDLIERDYDRILRFRTKDVYTFLAVLPYQNDYDMIAGHLQECYQLINKPGDAIATIRRFQQRKLVNEQHCESYTHLAWIHHRNRFFTQKEAPQLENSIEKNEALAMRYLDSSIWQAKQDQPYHEMFYGNSMERAMANAAFYKAILYTYSNNIDSGNKYYTILQNNGISNNNYATFLSIQGKFGEAVKFYQIAQEEDYDSEKKLQEYTYYQALLSNYNAQPKKGIQLCRSTIAKNGVTPGYGWYNLALARNLLYDGQIAKAQACIAKAENFREVHLGTTLGKPHYDFTLSLLKLIAKEKEIAALKFRNKRWWLSPSAIGKLLALTIEKYTVQYFLINQFANNPERDLVIYKLFSTESTISFDEVWYLIKDFSTDFFIAKYKKELSTNNRPLLNKYFSLYLAKLYQANGDNANAKAILDTLHVQSSTNTQSYDQLYLYRLWQAKSQLLSIGSKERQQLEMQMLQLYPMLACSEKVNIPTSLRYSGPMGKVEKEILKKIQSSSINFVDEDKAAAEVFLSFDTKENLKICTLQHKNKLDNKVISGYHTIGYNNAEEGANNIIAAMYNSGTDSTSRAQ
ncbi:MAG: hypothetical protein RL660_3027 [Bacteroidota bacterium]|jgi:hypothetical protein